MRYLLYFFVATSILSCSVSESYRYIYIPDEVHFTEIDKLNVPKGDTLAVFKNIDLIDESEFFTQTLADVLLDKFESEAGARRYFTIKSHDYDNSVAVPELPKTSRYVVLDSLKFDHTYSYSKEKIKEYTADNYLIRTTEMLFGKAAICGGAFFLLHDKNGAVIDSCWIEEEYSYEVKGRDTLEVNRILKKGIAKAYRNVMKLIAFNYAERVVPYFTMVKRNYYVGSITSNLFEEVVNYTREDDWDGAFAYWQSCLDDKKMIKKDRAKMYFNIGVYFEKQGNLHKAIASLEEAYFLKPEIAKNYLDALKELDEKRQKK